MSESHPRPETDERDEDVENVAPGDDQADEAQTPVAVASRIEEMPAADGAAVMQRLPAEMSAEAAEYLDPDTAGQILAEMDPTLAASVIAHMEAPEASMVLAAMDPDDRVDILEHVPARLHDQLVGEMDAS